MTSSTKHAANWHTCLPGHNSINSYNFVSMTPFVFVLGLGLRLYSGSSEMSSSSSSCSRSDPTNMSMPASKIYRNLRATREDLLKQRARKDKKQGNGQQGSAYTTVCGNSCTNKKMCQDEPKTTLKLLVPDIILCLQVS